MRYRSVVIVAAGLTAAQASYAQQRIDHAEHHQFVIDNFKTESGVVLPKAIVVYGTYGHLNAAHDNAILLPSHYMATHHGYEWLIGPGRALDTATMFLVATELFGNGHSSSPSNTPEPYHGPRFPVTTIRDNVEAVHRLLVDDLKITHLRARVHRDHVAKHIFWINDDSSVQLFGQSFQIPMLARIGSLYFDKQIFEALLVLASDINGILNPIIILAELSNLRGHHHGN